MAKKYLDQLNTLAEQFAAGAFEDAALECRHFFSGAALYVNGKICITLTPAGLALKLPEESRRRLMVEHGATQLRYFPKAPVKKDYVVLPEAMRANDETLHEWLEASIQYVLAS